MHQLGLSGADDDLLDCRQVCTMLRLRDRRALDRLIALKAFPEGKQIAGKKQQFWQRADVVAYLHLMLRGCHLGTGTASPKENPTSGEE